jgi:hypothetical protein
VSGSTDRRSRRGSTDRRSRRPTGGAETVRGSRKRRKPAGEAGNGENWPGEQEEQKGMIIRRRNNRRPRI